MQTKNKALEVIEVCYLRKDADLPCTTACTEVRHV